MGRSDADASRTLPTRTLLDVRSTPSVPSDRCRYMTPPVPGTYPDWSIQSTKGFPATVTAVGTAMATVNATDADASCCRLKLGVSLLNVIAPTACLRTYKASAVCQAVSNVVPRAFTVLEPGSANDADTNVSTLDPYRTWAFTSGSSGSYSFRNVELKSKPCIAHHAVISFRTDARVFLYMTGIPSL